MSTNLEWLDKVKKADGNVDKVIKKAEGELKDGILADVIIEYRKIRALEIIAEELCKLNELFVKVKNTGLKIKK